MRTLLIATLLIVAVFVIWAYPTGVPRFWEPRPPAAEVGTSGTVDKARERGAELGAKAAVAGEKIKDAAHDAAITSKIKAKMALDDTVKARDIHVAYADGVVTLTGSVATASERKRAVDLARETNGVRSVSDKLTMIR